MKTAPSEQEARLVENEIWTLWVDAAPTPDIKQKTQSAMEKRAGYDFEGARLILNEVVEQAPDYPEGWNQRAFVLFLQGNLDESLADLDVALELEPRHFGALAGKARILMTQGRMRLGQSVLREAITLYPFIRERSMLLPLPGEEPPAGTEDGIKL